MNTVLLVGAGFSSEITKGGPYPEQIPVTKDFLRTAEEAANGGLIDKDAVPDLFKLIRHVLQYKAIDIEELYNMVAISTALHEHFWINQTYPVEPEPILKQLQYLIASFLLGLVKKHRIDWMKSCSLLLTKLKPTSVICLNWDTVLDSVFYDFFREPMKNYLFAGFEWYGFRGDDFRVIGGKPELESHGISDGVHLLKLHGSLNWFRCRDNNHIKIVGPDQAADWIGDDNFRCVFDSSKVDPLILPPSSAKDYSISPFPSIWRTALVDLERADQLIVYGCNFRAADFYLIDLLFKARLKRKDKDLSIKVIDKSPIEIIGRIEAATGYKNVTEYK
jgi:hypothetical protein